MTTISGGDLDLMGPVRFINGDMMAFIEGDATVSGGVTSTGTGTVLMIADGSSSAARST